MPLKVTEFDPAATLDGTEIFGFVQSAGNVQADLDEIAAYVSAFVTGGGATLELIRDTIGTALVAGTGITVTVNDGADTITIATTITQYTDEMARDAIGTALTEGAGIDLTVSDVGDTITVASTITQYTDEMARDAIGEALVAGTGINIVEDDAGDHITISVFQEWAPNFTADADVYIPAVTGMTIAAGNAPIGTGSLDYEKSTTAAPGTFSSTGLPVTLEAGAWLKVSASGVSGFYAAHFVRTA